MNSATQIYKNFKDLTRSELRLHYSRMFSVFVWACNWILFMHGSLYLIHQIGWKSFHFEKRLSQILGNLWASAQGSIHTSNLLGVNYCVNFSLNNGLFIAQVPKTCCKISNDDPLNPEISTDDYDRCQLHAERQVDSSDILWTTVSTYTHTRTHASISYRR